jgi:hypothetical protein
MSKKDKQTKNYPNGITIEKINSIRINKSIYTPGSLYIKKPDVYPGVWLITRHPLGIREADPHALRRKPGFGGIHRGTE